MATGSRRRRRRRGGRGRGRQGGGGGGGGGGGSGPGGAGSGGGGTAVETSTLALDDAGLLQAWGDEPSPPPPDPDEVFEAPSLEALYGLGVLEGVRDGHGFLRQPERMYQTDGSDPYVSPSLIRQYGLRNGVTVDGEVGPPKRKGQNPQLVSIRSVCGIEPHLYHQSPKWDELTVIDPERQIDLTSHDNDVTLRIISMLSPIGFGQRGLLVSPPRAGKTMILQKIAGAVQANHPDVYLMVLLVDERPEEATAMSRAVKGEVAVSTNDNAPDRHVHVTETVLRKAKRLVETGKDVVILMDSLTRLGRAYNLLQRGSGRTLSGGIDARTLEKPKAFFGAARNVEGGGSLTIIATALIETGSRMDQVIFEEFKGTGNMELVLDRQLAEQRIWPAIDVNKSGTRKEEKLIAPDTLERVYTLRRVINKVRTQEATNLLIGRLDQTKTNDEFLAMLSTPRDDDDEAW